MSKYLKISIVIVCIAAAAGWWYASNTFVEFRPLVLDENNEKVEVEAAGDFYPNIEKVLKEEHIDYKFDILNHPNIPLIVAMNKSRVLELTRKATDILWLYEHRDRNYPSFPCVGDGYEGVVYYKNSSEYRSDSAIDLTCEDIKLTEQVFQSEVKKAGGIGHFHINVPLIKYFREYYGYRNRAGDIIVRIEMPLKEDISTLRYGSSHDGGDVILHAEINLTRKEIVWFHNNGSV